MCGKDKLQASSKKYFLRIWTEDFTSEKIMEKAERFCVLRFFHSAFMERKIRPNTKKERFQRGPVVPRTSAPDISIHPAMLVFLVI